jgi:hypothetical protein
VPNPATSNDIMARWRPLTHEERARAGVLLGDAWVTILGRRPAIEADMSAGTVLKQTVTKVICQMVLRVMKNPDGYDEESIDDWRGRRNALAASGQLTITAEELADITPSRASRRSVRLVAYGEVR